jgi:WD40 repeat protein/tRNA A-37 threonylcarbamoyl transferase component Bud32/energy-coupling factor transporter ATP-binding protein EcfA2
MSDVAQSEFRGSKKMPDLSHKQLGKYQIKDVLGRGAMAQVYRAFQPDLERDVAIKVIHSHLVDDPDFVHRFRHEAKAIAALRHPGIIQVYDFIAEGNTFCIVMELVPGESLQERLAAAQKRGERIPLNQALHLFQLITQAVAYAHDKGVYHRDLKPANVLFVSQDQPILVDFGLSRIVGTRRLADAGTIVGTPTYMSPEQGSGEAGDARSDVYSLGVMLYELTTGVPPFGGDSSISIILRHLDEPLPPPRSINPDLPIAVEQVIQKTLEKSPSNRYQSAQELLEALDEIALPTPSLAAEMVVPLDTRCPYRGLQVFEEDHAEFYFGREALIHQLVEKMEALTAESQPASARPVQFLAVLGASGSGKSSLVRAGLIPVLREGVVPGSADWVIQVMKPGSRPLTELAVQLTTAMAGEEAPPDVTVRQAQDAAQLRNSLVSDGRALHLAMRRAWSDGPPERRLLLVVDQLEEIFTLCDDEKTRRRFIENLLYATAVGDGRVMVLLTMRADFYHRCAVYRDLAGRLSARHVLVGSMDEAELRRAIERPAQRVGLKFEPGLVDTILADVARQPGALPLLQHALLELWEQRQGRLLTLSAYQASGGVSWAIAQRAETLYAGFGSDEQAIVQRIMLRLTQPGEGTEDTRRRARKRELVTGTDEQQTRAVEEVLQQLADARLITTSRDMASGEELVDVSHEALIRGWVRLQGWIDEDRAALRVHRQLTEAAYEWEQHNRDQSYLYRGAHLAQAEEWAETHSADLSELEGAFVEASRAAAGAIEQEKEAARQRELAQAQALAEAERKRAEVQTRTGRRLRWLTAGLAVVFLLAIGAAGWARGEQRRAQAAAELSQSMALATSAQLALGEDNTDLALALALAANRMDDPPAQAQLTLYEAAYAPSTRRLFDGHTEAVRSVVLSPDGRTALSGSADHSLILWDVETGEVLRRFEGHSDVVQSVTFSPDGRTALSGSADHSLILWDLKTGEMMRRFEGHSDIVHSVALSADGRTALSGSGDHTLILWNLETGEAIRRLEGHSDIVFSVALSPDGQAALSGSADRDLILWDLETGEAIRRFEGHTDWVTGVVFGPNGHTALSGSADTDLILWDLESGAEIQHVVGESGEVLDVALSSDGRTALSGTSDSKLISWDLQSGEVLQQFLGHAGPVFDVAISPDGRTALSGSGDGHLRLWDLQSGAEMRRLVYDAWATSVAISPDGRTALTGLGDGSLSWWDLQSGAEIRRLEGHTDMLFAGVRFGPDGRTALSGSGDVFDVSEDNTLRLWDLETGQEIRRFEGHSDYLWGVDMSSDGRFAVSGAQDFRTCLWDIQSGAKIRCSEGDLQLRSVAISPDGRTFLVGPGRDLPGGRTTSDYSVRLYDLETGEEIRRLSAHSASVAGLAFSPDGRTALSGAFDSLMILWDLESGTEIRRFPGHSAGLLSIAFSADGRTALSGALDQTLILWDLESGAAIRRFLGHNDFAMSVALSPDGRAALSAGFRDQTVRLWRIDASLDELRAWVQANRYVPELTCEQRAQYRVEPLCDAESER